MLAVLHKVTIQRSARGHNDFVPVFQGLYQLMFSVVTPPHDYSFLGRHACIHNLIPANHGLSFRSQHVGYPTDKIMLKSYLIAQILVLDELLNLRIGIPALVSEMYFVATYMNIG